MASPEASSLPIEDDIMQTILQVYACGSLGADKDAPGYLEVKARVFVGFRYVDRKLLWMEHPFGYVAQDFYPVKCLEPDEIAAQGLQNLPVAPSSGAIAQASVEEWMTFTPFDVYQAYTLPSSDTSDDLPVITYAD